jgi:uncharacterized membrane protein (Fun14 family)
MDMEEVNENKTFSFNNYWPSVVIVGAIFSLVSFVIGLYFGYQQINAEPSGSFISPVMISSGVICLATAFAGMLAVWHYTKEVSPVMKLGQGALVGFLTGAAIVLFSTILNEIWLLIDPEYTEKLIEATIANVEAMDLPSDARNDMVDAMAESMQGQSFFKQLFIGIPVPGLLNMATAMIGVKLFAQKEDDISF